MKKLTNFVSSWSVKTFLTVSVLSAVLYGSRAASNRFSAVDRDTAKIGDVRTVENKLVSNSTVGAEMMSNEANERELGQVMEQWVALSTYWDSEEDEMTISEEAGEVSTLPDHSSTSATLSGDSLASIQFHAENFIADSEF